MNSRRVLLAGVALLLFTLLVLLGNGRTADTAVGATLTRMPDGSMVLARAGVQAPVLDLFEDFDCPVCKQMEHDLDGAMERLADAGQVKVVYHPVTIFSQDPMRANSIRAASAARCVPTADWLAFRSEVYAMQPAPHGTASGFTTEELIAAGHRVGVKGAEFETCVTTQRHAPAHLAETAKIPLEGTPTLLLNGRQLQDEVFDPVALERALNSGVTV